MNGRDRRDLFAAAGGEANVAGYCAGLTTTAPSATTATTEPGATSKSHPAHPTHANTHSHPGSHS